MSPSSRGRGLKYIGQMLSNLTMAVALFTRAWIEIYAPTCTRYMVLVALFTRAWIEISLVFTITSSPQRRPLHEGVDWNSTQHLKKSLKRCRPLHEGVDWNNLVVSSLWLSLSVALFTRAWIEIFYSVELEVNSYMSPSSRGRGLKYGTLSWKF